MLKLTFNPLTGSFEFIEKNGVSGSMSSGFLPKSNGAQSLEDSIVFQNVSSPVGASITIDSASNGMDVEVPSSLGLNSIISLTNSVGTLWEFLDNGDIHKDGGYWEGAPNASSAMGGGAGNLELVTTGIGTGFGRGALRNLSTGIGTGFGENSLRNLTTGTSNYGFGQAGPTLVSGNNNILIGDVDVHSASATSVFVVGVGAKSTQDKQIVFGSDDSVNKIFESIHNGQGVQRSGALLGSGIFSYKVTDLASGSPSNSPGMSVRNYSGSGTGTGTSAHEWYTAPAGVSGTAVNAHVKAGQISGDGSILWNNDIEVQGAGNGIVLTKAGGGRVRLTVNSDLSLDVSNI